MDAVSTEIAPASADFASGALVSLSGTETSILVPRSLLEATRTSPPIECTLSLIPASPNELPRELLVFVLNPTPSSSTSRRTRWLLWFRMMLADLACECLATLCSASCTTR